MTLVGVITLLNENACAGAITAPGGQQYYFDYVVGENLMMCDDSPVPLFTGHHEQPEGSRLKLPMVGDAVVFVPDAEGASSVRVWGYASHFVYLTERRYGSGFRNTAGRELSRS